MKTIVSLLGGAVVLTEQGGVITLSLDATLGGGTAGILKGQASLVLDVASGVKLGEGVLNAVIAQRAPALVPLVQVVEGVANQALATLE